jgi:hypothetical protein
MLKLLPDFSTMSRGQKKTASLFAALFFVPFLILMGIQIYNALLLSNVGSDIAYAQNVWRAEAKALSDQVEPASLKSPQARNAFQLVEQQQSLIPERQLNLTMEVPLKDMRNLKNQVNVPLEDLENGAMAATQSLAVEECERLKTSLAADCAVISANGRLIGENAFQYQIQLAYVERDKFGKTNETDRYDFIASRMVVGKNATANRAYFARSAEIRGKIYQDIAKTCRTMRKDVGTCSVTAISLASKLEPGLPMVRLAASATFASMIRKKAVASLLTQ